MRIRVTKKYDSEFPDPLNLKRGETVEIDLTKNDHPGWRFCLSQGNKGWIPESYLSIEGSIGRLTRDYNAHELSLTEGDVLELLEEEAGWYWCKTGEEICGWFPKAMTEIVGP